MYSSYITFFFPKYTHYTLYGQAVSVYYDSFGKNRHKVWSFFHKYLKEMWLLYIHMAPQCDMKWAFSAVQTHSANYQGSTYPLDPSFSTRQIYRSLPIALTIAIAALLGLNYKVS